MQYEPTAEGQTQANDDLIDLLEDFFRYPKTYTNDLLKEKLRPIMPFLIKSKEKPLFFNNTVCWGSNIANVVIKQ